MKTNDKLNKVDNDLRDRDIPVAKVDPNPDLPQSTKEVARDDNPDAITGEPGSHPVGTGVGAGAAGAAGAAIGVALGGPIGGAIGAAVGAIAGGYAGKGVAETIDPTAEDAYWRDEYARRAYVLPGTPYDLYAPAYRYGWESHGEYEARPFEEIEPDLRDNWESRRGESTLDWERARPATQDAYRRVEELRTRSPY